MIDFSKPIVINGNIPATLLGMDNGQLRISSPYIRKVVSIYYGRDWLLFGDDGLLSPRANYSEALLNTPLQVTNRKETPKKLNIGEYIGEDDLNLIYLNYRDFRRGVICYTIMPGGGTALVTLSWLKPGERYDKRMGAKKAIDRMREGMCIPVPVTQLDFVYQLRAMFLIPDTPLSPEEVCEHQGHMEELFVL